MPSAPTDGATIGGASLGIGVLSSDVKQRRVVSVADLGLVNALPAQVVDARTFVT